MVAYFSMTTKLFLQAQLAMLTIIYVRNNNRKYPLSHWVGIITAIHANIVNSLPSGFAYITTYTRAGGGWVVTLPSNLGVTPRQKHFTLSSYPSLDAALLAAVSYRDMKLTEALSKRNLI